MLQDGRKTSSTDKVVSVAKARSLGLDLNHKRKVKEVPASHQSVCQKRFYKKIKKDIKMNYFKNLSEEQNRLNLKSEKFRVNAIVDDIREDIDRGR